MRIGLRVRLLLPPAVLLVGIAAVTWWAVGVAAHTVERQIDTQIRAIARTLSGPPTFPLTDAVLNQMKGLSGVEFVLVNRTGERLSTFPDANIPLPTNLGVPLHIGDSEFLAEKVTLRAPHPVARSPGNAAARKRSFAWTGHTFAVSQNNRCGSTALNDLWGIATWLKRSNLRPS